MAETVVMEKVHGIQIQREKSSELPPKGYKKRPPIYISRLAITCLSDEQLRSLLRKERL